MSDSFLFGSWEGIIPTDGLFYINFMEGNSDDFIQHARTLNPANYPDNHWLREAWTHQVSNNIYFKIIQI